MKKLISLALGILMTTSVCASAGAAEVQNRFNRNKEHYMSVDFESQAIAKEGYTYITKAGAKLQTFASGKNVEIRSSDDAVIGDYSWDIKGENYGKSLKVKGKSGCTIRMESGAITGGILVYEFDYAKSSTEASSNAVEGFFTNNNGNTNQSAGNISFWPEGKINALGTDVGTYEADTWYHIAYEADMNTDTVYAYIDNELVASKAMGNGGCREWFRTNIASTYAANSNDQYIDNLKIYKYVASEHKLPTVDFQHHSISAGDTYARITDTITNANIGIAGADTFHARGSLPMSIVDSPVADDDGNKVLCLAPTANDQYLRCEIPQPNNGHIMVWETDYAVGCTDKKTTPMCAYKTGPSAVLAINFNDTGYIQVGGKDLVKYEANKWYNLAIRYNVNAKRIYAYVNGEIVFDMACTWDAWLHTRFADTAFALAENSTPGYYDNIKVYQYDNKTDIIEVNEKHEDGNVILSPVAVTNGMPEGACLIAAVYDGDGVLVNAAVSKHHTTSSRREVGIEGFTTPEGDNYTWKIFYLNDSTLTPVIHNLESSK